jgi:hypothetical protein
MLALLVPGVGMGAGVASEAPTAPATHVNRVTFGVVTQPTVEVSGGR